MKLLRLRSMATAVAALLVSTTLATGAASAAPQAVNYVALGDSYSSGVGAGSYSGGDCLRSANAYPEKWRAANSPSSYSFTACSGAVTTDVTANQLGPLNSATTLVTISIGGNDAGFADAMTTCVIQGTTACVNRINTARAYIQGTLPGRLDAVYQAIRAKAPSARVVVMGYPRFYKLQGSCAVGLSETSRGAINGAADLLSDVIAKRAADNGFAYGDVRGAFTGHEICSGDSWLHSVRLPVVKESYHPTSTGQASGYYPVLERLA